MVLHLTSSHSAPFVRFLPLCCVARNAPSTKVLAPCIYSNKPAAVRTSKLPSPGSALHKDRPSCEIIPGLSISWGRQRPCAEQTKAAPASRPSPTQETQHLPHTHTHSHGNQSASSCCLLVRIHASPVLSTLNKIRQMGRALGEKTPYEVCESWWPRRWHRPSPFHFWDHKRRLSPSCCRVTPAATQAPAQLWTTLSKCCLLPKWQPN